MNATETSSRLIAPDQSREDFELPQFTRMAWVSDEAKAHWQPRLQHVVLMQAQMAVAWIQAGNNTQVNVIIKPAQLLALQPQLVLNGIELTANSLTENHPLWPRSAKGAITPLLYDATMQGVPPSTENELACCRSVAEGRKEQGWVDPAWAAIPTEGLVEGKPILSRSPLAQLQLLAALKLWPLDWHLFHADCSEATKAITDWIDLESHPEFGAAIDTLKEVMQWPVEWSALHGIAEVKTPVFRISTSTVPTRDKFVVRTASEKQVLTGAAGIVFPYRQQKKAVLTDSKAYQAGLANPIVKPTEVSPNVSRPTAPTDVDWTRIAAPQADGYDTEIALAFRDAESYPWFSSPDYEDSPTFFGGRVRTAYLKEQFAPRSELVNAPIDHPNIAIAEEMLKKWPQIWEQFGRLVHTIHPMLDSRNPTGLGSSSHSEGHLPGAIYATVWNSHGLAQAMVHEMAHTKLRYLGVQLETSSRFFTNPLGQLFESPIRKDKMRPMAAVFHAQYSFIHVTALDLKMLAGKITEEQRMAWLELLGRNIPRMEHGLHEIRQHARLDAVGEAFMAGFYEWADSVIEAGLIELDPTRG